MRRRFSKYIFLSLSILIVIAVLIGYGVWNKPHESIKNAVAVEINAVALYHSLAHDSAHAEIFINKVVAVIGKVKQVYENRQKQQVILLQTNVEGGSVNCTMEENKKGIKAGDILALKGICIGYSGEDNDMQLPGDVFLVRCYRS
ncbi:MAG: hypothetical protein ABI325_04960 [Ginsengibacter sp.]